MPASDPPLGPVPLNELLVSKPAAPEAESEIVSAPVIEKKKRNRQPRNEASRAKEANRRLCLTNDLRAAKVKLLTTSTDRSNKDHKYLWIFRCVLGVFGLSIVIVWQYCILQIIEKSGDGRLKIDDKVMIVLVSTTTANVFGFLLIIMNFVFSSPDNVSGRKSRRKSRS